MTNDSNCKPKDEKTRPCTASGGKWNSNRIELKPAQRPCLPRLRRLAGLFGRRAPLLCRFSRDHPRSRIVREVSGSPLVGWWEALTEGFRRCRLVVERIQQRLDDVAAWLAQSVSVDARRRRGLSRRSIFDGADLCGDQEMEAEALCPAEGTEERDALCPWNFITGVGDACVQDVAREAVGASGNRAPCI
jgi:hypothetical protein